MCRDAWLSGGACSKSAGILGVIVSAERVKSGPRTPKPPN